MNNDTTIPEYLSNPKLHYQKLMEFHDRLTLRVLGEEDIEWRGELEFVLDRTKAKIREVQRKLV